MFEGLKNHTQDILFISFLFLSFFWLMISMKIFSSDVANIVGPIGYFAIIAVGIPATTFAVQFILAPYPYIEMIVRPSNERYNLFIEQSDEAVEMKINEGNYATTLPLKFAETFTDYDKCKKIILHHKREWGNDLLFRPGTAFWNGMPVSHPQTELIVVTQAPRATMTRDHGESIPVFFLEDSSKFHSSFGYLEDLDIESKSLPGNPDTKSSVEILIKQLSLTRKELAEANRQKFEWHTKTVAAEEVIDQQRTELDGLRESGMTMNERVSNRLLELLMVYSNIKDAWKASRGKKPLSFINTWVVMIVIAGLTFTFFALNPDLSSGIGMALTNPINQIVLLIFVGLMVAAIYIWKSGGIKR